MFSTKNKIVKGLLYSLVLTLFLTGCGKKIITSEVSSSENQDQKPPEKLKPIDLGMASDFAILAYANITSNPNSSINGKVGLKPGTRAMIALEPAEVIGGASDIMGSDDETIPMNLLSNAKVDMVSAYGKEVASVPDADKIGIFNGNIDGKHLKSGVYKWNSGLSIANDFTLEGNEDDVWIFKIPGHMKIGSGVHMILNSGAKAKNIFWQVSGSAVIDTDSEISGTIIAQQFIELKKHSILNGRAFVKNGYINLDKATINKP